MICKINIQAVKQLIQKGFNFPYFLLQMLFVASHFFLFHYQIRKLLATLLFLRGSKNLMTEDKEMICKVAQTQLLTINERKQKQVEYCRKYVKQTSEPFILVTLFRGTFTRIFKKHLVCIYRKQNIENSHFNSTKCALLLYLHYNYNRYVYI